MFVGALSSSITFSVILFSCQSCCFCWPVRGQVSAMQWKCISNCTQVANRAALRIREISHFLPPENQIKNHKTFPPRPWPAACALSLGQHERSLLVSIQSNNTNNLPTSGSAGKISANLFFEHTPEQTSARPIVPLAPSSEPLAEPPGKAGRAPLALAGALTER